MVVLTLGLGIPAAIVLYLSLTCPWCPPPEPPPPPGMTVAVNQAGANWSIEILTAPAGEFPTSTYLRIWDSLGSPSLARTAFSNLTVAHWDVYRVVYRDAYPGVTEIRPSDSILIDRAAYPSGCTFRIDNGTRDLAAGILQ